MPAVCRTDFSVLILVRTCRKPRTNFDVLFLVEESKCKVQASQD